VLHSSNNLNLNISRKDQTMRIIYFRIRCQFLLTLFLLVPATLGAASASPTLEVLREIESKKIRILQQMERLPEVVDGQVNQVMARLDTFWESEPLELRFTKLLTDLESAMDDVRIPERYSDKDVVSAMYGSAFSKEAINKIIAEYTELLMASVQNEIDAFTGGITTQMTTELQTELEAAQQEIAALFDESLSGQFPYWPNAFQTVTLDELVVRSPDVRTGPHPLQAAGVAALIALSIAKAISKKISAKVGAKVAGKIAGKVFLKFIPVVGWVIIAVWTAWDLQNARKGLETNVRKEVLATYVEELVPTSLWRDPAPDGSPSARETTEKMVREKLELWARESNKLVESLLETALLLENPAFARFIEERAEQGRSIREIAALSQDIMTCFGPLAHRAPSVDIMLDMMVSVSSRDELIRFRRKMGPALFELYAEYRQELLNAISSIGPDYLAEMIRQNRDWQTYHPDLSLRGRLTDFDRKFKCLF